jgi:hypothetical protein
MATILVLFCGLLGMVAGLVSLALGAGALLALTIWVLCGSLLVGLGLAFAFRARPASALARA